MAPRTWSQMGRTTLYYDSVRRSPDRAHSDDRARAVLRAPRHAVQRVSSHSGAHRAWAPGRSGDVSVRPRRDDGRACGCFAVSGRRSCTASASVRRWRSSRSICLLALTVVRRAMSARYDAIHSHEEGGLIGVVVAALLRIPHLYDMHSSLPQQLTNFAFSRSRLIRGVFLAIERVMIRRSRVVIVICPSLQETVREIDPGARSMLIENAPGSSGRVRRPRSRRPRSAGSLDCCRRRRWCLYTGTFEAYQGLDLLFAAMAHVRSTDSGREAAAGRREAASGGEGQSDRRARRESRMSPIFAGERPSTEIPAYLRACDVLVSPRSRGTNTPLKIYQYLRSGKPIVATRLLTHTQVLSDDTAILTDATRRGVRRRDCRGAAGHGAGGARRGAGARAGRDEIQLRGLSRADATGLRGALPRAFRRQSADVHGGASAEGRRVSEPRSRDHYSYSVYADPATAKSFDRRRFGGPIGQMVASAQAEAIERFAGPDQRSDDSGRRDRERAGPRCCMARAGRVASPRSTPPRRCSPSRGSGRPRHRSRFGSPSAMRTGSNSPIGRSTSSISLRVLMHAADWERLSGRAVPRVEPAGDHRLSVGAQRRAVAGDRPAR